MSRPSRALLPGGPDVKLLNARAGRRGEVDLPVAECSFSLTELGMDRLQFVGDAPGVRRASLTPAFGGTDQHVQASGSRGAEKTLTLVDLACNQTCGAHMPTTQATAQRVAAGERESAPGQKRNERTHNRQDRPSATIFTPKKRAALPRLNAGANQQRLHRRPALVFSGRDKPGTTAQRS